MPAEGKKSKSKAARPAGRLLCRVRETLKLRQTGGKGGIRMTSDVRLRAVIITNGHLTDPAGARQHVRAGDWVICADGGAHHARAMGIVPDVVIGDLDSIDPGLRAELEAAGVRFEVHPARKDETDLELALRLAVAGGAAEIDVLAVLGGRLDQSLANLLLLARPEWASAQVRVIEENEVAWPVWGGQTTSVAGAVDDTLSLVPLTPTVTGVTLEGVEWPLHDATLHFGSTWTISNALSASTARLEVGEGLVLVVHQSVCSKEK
jgi:thiamine pyrophosphokinase